MLKYLTICCFVFSSVEVLSQTIISPPPAKVEFSELGSMKLKKNKAFKSQDRFKQDKLKGITKVLKFHTDYDKYQIERLTTIISSLDSASLEEFDKDLNETVDFQDERIDKSREKYNEVKEKEEKAKTYKDKSKKVKGAKGKYKQEVQDSLRSRSKTKDELVNLGKDTLSAYTSKELDKDIEIDSLSWDSVDSLLLGRRSYDNISLDSLSLDSTSYSSDQSEVEKFLDSFVTKQAKKQGLMLPEENKKTTEVKNYIPELEKYDYVKPEIPEEKLSKALIEQEKERQVDELKKSITEQFDKEEEASIKQRFVERWKIGGFLEYKPRPNVIEVTPTLAYGFTERLAIGIGYSTIIPLGKNNKVNRQVAYRSYLDYLFYRSFYIHVESEWKERKLEELPSVSERSTYIGLGRNLTYKKITTSVLALYNFDAPNQIDTRRFSVRFSINFNP